MAPGRYLQDQPRFEALRDGLAEGMSLVGLRVNERGKVARAAATATILDEVAQLAGRMRTELRRCGVHAEVVRYCEEELLRRSLFHAVFEATKGVSAEMERFLATNPGLLSRFTKTIEFIDYTPDELLAIVSGLLCRSGETPSGGPQLPVVSVAEPYARGGCCPALKMSTRAALTVSRCGCEKTPPGGCRRGLGVQGVVVVFNLP
jgi:hypothetical protein